MKQERDYTEDKFLSSALERLRTNYFSKRDKIEKLFDIEDLKNKVQHIKEKSIGNLETNLEKFLDILNERNINRIVVKDKKEAQDVVLNILKQNSIKKIVKSKSLTTEEIELNGFLEKNSFEVVETDLGEWLVQINHEPPTHMTAPAIHMPKEKINELLNRVFNADIDVEPKTMVDFSKNKIKENFYNAQCGIIGSNILSLESGSFFIVSNEGNIQNVLRQKTVICVVGIDKIVETDKEAFKILELLPKAATGQITTSYIDILTKPYGKFYVVFIDNGRKKLQKDESFKEILSCIRCGACQNACPVYTTVGGAFFRGKTYAGPIGILLSYLINDTPNIKEYTELCTGCMACDEICSSKIGLQHIIMTIKSKYTKNTPGIKGLVIKHIENRYGLLRTATYLSHFLFKKELKTHIKKIDRYLGNNFRPLPGIKKSFDIIKTDRASIGLFAGCSTNFIYTNVGHDTLSVAKKLGVNIEVIKQKSCCGAPALYNGEKKSALRAAQINTDYLMSLNFEKIIFLDPHCAHMIKRDYTLLSDNPKVKELSDKVVCAGAFFIDLIEKSGIKLTRLGSFIGYHHPCHLNRGLHYSLKLHDFIEKNEPNFTEIRDADRCCGFAGTYSIMHPHISKKLLENKINSITDAHLQTLITACPGCMMQIGGGLKIARLNIELLHFVSYLDRIL